jgi:hypothetical protein
VVCFNNVYVYICIIDLWYRVDTNVLQRDAYEKKTAETNYSKHGTVTSKPVEKLHFTVVYYISNRRVPVCLFNSLSDMCCLCDTEW